VNASEVPAELDALTAQDHFLIERCEEARRDGLQLLRWMRQPDGSPSFFPIQLKKQFRLPYRNHGFFGVAEINGKQQSVMGTCQDVDFGSVPYPNAAQLISEFVLGHFLKLAHWKNPDGTVGGFTVEQELFRKIDGGHQRFSQDSKLGCIDWRNLGRLYAWVLVTIYINDFALEFAGIKKRLRQALCAVLSEEFVRIQQSPTGEYETQVSIAYPVVRYAPIPSYFGHAPGKFQVAVKSFSFLLTHRNEIKVRMEFASSPRCEKVLDVGKHWPDPIFGGARLLHKLRLLRDPQPFHDYLEGKMLGVHCAVHQAFIEGVETVWRDWAARNSAT
jgi:hypothetical protein